MGLGLVTSLCQYKFCYFDVKLSMKGENCGSKLKRHFSKVFKAPLHSNNDVTHSKSEHSTRENLNCDFVKSMKDMKKLN